MANLLVCDVPDARAQRLAEDAGVGEGEVSVKDLALLSETFADLRSASVTGRAWR